MGRLYSYDLSGQNLFATRSEGSATQMVDWPGMPVPAGSRRGIIATAAAVADV